MTSLDRNQFLNTVQAEEVLYNSASGFCTKYLNTRHSNRLR